MDKSLSDGKIEDLAGYFAESLADDECTAQEARAFLRGMAVWLNHSVPGLIKATFGLLIIEVDWRGREIIKLA